MLGALLESMRPKQWTKNLLVFAGLLFSRNLFHAGLLGKAALAFGIFCLLTGAVYLFNDIRDIEQDKAHPEKKKRPLASGRLPVSSAITSCALLLALGVSGAFLLHRGFGWVAAAYAAMMIGYSLVFKHVVILDVIVIALGFVLRAIAGAVVIDVTISSWLLVCTIFLALFMGLAKRRHELVLLSGEAAKHRKILNEYSPVLVDQMIAVVTASTVMAYALYTTSQETVVKFGTRNLIFTLPFVLYGIFRYLYLVHQKKLGGSPELILLKDAPMIVNILLYVVTAGLIIYLR